MDEIYNKVYTIRQFRCVRDGEEVKMKDIKKAIQSNEFDEIYIFGISNELYKEIMVYLNENGINYRLYGRSRIVLF